MVSSGIPIVDVAPLVAGGAGAGEAAAAAIGAACREHGFFYATGHGVDAALRERLEDLSRAFFALDLDRKLEIRMARGGRAWRGYFPVGAELTDGRPDQKEGLYFGLELDPSDPRVAAGLPLHGPNLFPDEPRGLRETVLDYTAAMTELGHALMRGIALSLGLDAEWFADRCTGDPLVLFRIFHYPALQGAAGDLWSVGEHSDYGLLTMLLQDAAGGLQVKTRAGWVDAPPIADSFVCNIGDMLDRMTGGCYRSTPHRVRNVSGHGRLSFPLFFDPGFDVVVSPIAEVVDDDAAERWDGESVHAFSGTYGEYLLRKVSRVFPDLGRDVL